ncbi:Forkhead box protein I1-A [Smittium culicis]|uniref:Forkhead box protein I1-A n=1 Tax=Smittium culicis TaxID=133412 RepID=A0A1R1Y3N8_9FUNG|nr:Forkhead box protein I1-A [Smittium culicis]
MQGSSNRLDGYLVDTSLRSSVGSDVNACIRGNNPIATYRKRRRPPFPYSIIISVAILKSSDKRMSLKEIYNWIKENYPKIFSGSDIGWQNTIRHNLSLNSFFKRIPRYELYQRSYDIRREKKSFWTIDVTKMDKITKEKVMNLLEQSETPKPTPGSILFSQENSKSPAQKKLSVSGDFFSSTFISENNNISASTPRNERFLYYPQESQTYSNVSTLTIDSQFNNAYKQNINYKPYSHTHGLDGNSYINNLPNTKRQYNYESYNPSKKAKSSKFEYILNPSEHIFSPEQKMQNISEHTNFSRPTFRSGVYESLYSRSSIISSSPKAHRNLHRQTLSNSDIIKLKSSVSPVSSLNSLSNHKQSSFNLPKIHTSPPKSPSSNSFHSINTENSSSKHSLSHLLN